MGILIDSCIWIDFERQGRSIKPAFQGYEEDEIFVSAVSASELLHGVYRAQNQERRARRLAFVEAILSTVPVLDIDLYTARTHAQLWSELTSRGDMIGIHDSWLAATCLAYGLTWVTNNEREFRRVPGLRVEIWRS